VVIASLLFYFGTMASPPPRRIKVIASLLFILGMMAFSCLAASDHR
jgi:hypothetical protein